MAATQTARIPATQTAEVRRATLEVIKAQTATAAVLKITPTLTAFSLRSMAECPADFCLATAHTFPLSRPVPVKIDATYRFASTQRGDREVHHGVELVAASGTPVLAAAEGRVAFAGDDLKEQVAPWPGFYGNYVVLEHQLTGQTLFTLYGHLSKIEVQAGQKVVLGQKIGEVGASGSAIGSHLHFEVRPGQNEYDRVRNPELWLEPLPGSGALAGWIFDPNNSKLCGAVRIQRMENNKIVDTPAYQSMDIYPPEMTAENGENFALSDLPAGQYRLTFLYNNTVYERFIEIETGILTFVTIILD